MSALVVARTVPRSIPWLRVGTVTIAAIQLLSTLSDMPGAFGDDPAPSNLLAFVQTVTSAELMIAPLIALTALGLALFGPLNHAILALGLLVLVAWIGDVPSIATQGLAWSPDFAGAEALCVYFIAPALGLAAVALSIGAHRLALAGVLAGIPPLAASAAAFAVVVGGPL